MDETVEYLGMTAGIVSSYVSNNSLSPSDLPALIREVHVALCQAGNGQTNQGKAPVLPAVSIKKSIMPDYLICLEDGKKFKSLKRHISTHYNLSPEEYREKWGLPADYPMVAPNYAKARSALARKMGLGQQRAPAKPSNKRGS